MSLLLSILIGAAPGEASAQTSRDARALITVVDTTGAVLPGAMVTITSLDAAPQAQPATPVAASDRGLATIGSLSPGRYAIKAEFAGFETGELKDVRLRAGDNKHVMVLELSGVQETVEVGQRGLRAARPNARVGSLV